MPRGYKQGGKADPSFWTDQISAAKEYRQKVAKEKDWDKWRKYYRGEWAGDTLASNIFFKMIRTVVPRVYFRDPTVSISPAKPSLENMLFAQLLGRIDNKLLRMMKTKGQFKKIVQDTIMFGTGFGKLGFGAQYTPTPDFFHTEAPERKGPSGGNLEYMAGIQANMPWFRRTHPGSVLLPAGLQDYDDAPWIGHWVRRPLEDLQADPRFKHTKHLGPGSPGVVTGKMKSQEWRNPVPMVDLYEIRDLIKRQVFVMAPHVSGGNKILLQEDDEMQFNNRFPFFQAIFNDDDEYAWGLPDSVILEPLQLEMNEIRTSIMYHRRIALAKILAKKGVISEDNKAKLVGEDVLPIIDVDGDPYGDINFISGNTIPDDLIKAQELVMQDVRETIGFSRNQFAEYTPGSGDTTATEARIVQMATEIRVDERRDKLADMLVDMVNHMHHIIFNKWTQDVVVDIMGPQGVPIWVKFRPDMLRNAAYEVKIDPDASVPETRGVREQKAVQVYQLLQGNRFVDPYTLTKYLVTELKGTEYDNMVRLPPGMLGSQENPMAFAQLLQQYQQAAQGGESGGGGSAAQSAQGPAGARAPQPNSGDNA